MPFAAGWLGSHGPGGQALVQAGSSEQQKEWLPGVVNGEKLLALAQQEADSRWALHRVKTRAEQTSDGWRIDGEKIQVLDGHVADALVVVARTAGGDDDASDIVLGDNGQASFIGAFVLAEILSTAPAEGGNDIITTGNGPDVVLGGSFTDIVLAAADDTAAITFLELLGTTIDITPTLVAELIATGAGDAGRDGKRLEQIRVLRLHLGPPVAQSRRGIQMEPEDTELFEALAGDLLAELGYPLCGARPAPAVRDLARHCRARWEDELMRRGERSPVVPATAPVALPGRPAPC